MRFSNNLRGWVANGNWVMSNDWCMDGMDYWRCYDYSWCWGSSGNSQDAWYNELFENNIELIINFDFIKFQLFQLKTYQFEHIDSFFFGFWFKLSLNCLCWYDSQITDTFLWTCKTLYIKNNSVMVYGWDWVRAICYVCVCCMLTKYNNKKLYTADSIYLLLLFYYKTRCFIMSIIVCINMYINKANA